MLFITFYQTVEQVITISFEGLPSTGFKNIQLAVTTKFMFRGFEVEKYSAVCPFHNRCRLTEEQETFPQIGLYISLSLFNRNDKIMQPNGILLAKLNSNVQVYLSQLHQSFNGLEAPRI